MPGRYLESGIILLCTGLRVQLRWCANSPKPSLGLRRHGMGTHSNSTLSCHACRQVIPGMWAGQPCLPQEALPPGGCLGHAVQVQQLAVHEAPSNGQCIVKHAPHAGQLVSRSIIHPLPCCPSSLPAFRVKLLDQNSEALWQLCSCPMRAHALLTTTDVCISAAAMGRRLIMTGGMWHFSIWATQQVSAMPG